MIQMIEKKYISEKEFQLIPVTQDVRDFVEASGIQNGVVFVITSHTTSGIIVNENLDCLYTDIEETLERLIPTNFPYVHSHFLPSYGATGGNAPGHLKSILSGNHCVMPIKDGKIQCGFAQDIYFAEFDGPQVRRIFIQVMGD
ncbi:secondary thiamine-phosphate synthase enzyme YjbQ [Neobacillus drentensis]|uniref:secondary thiamine-phosphate synthase enzyme YjbQ n=1 Tax=Neobacillus drentensis TaxID=220684 RepID=UPI001EEE1B4D|nr:secondary thiamine-phosphate synthase enzyme YjbQ [Neobacillus drentensis]ULT59525.1 secondary thiamine-phosphate synthase enzyme YjbQ [Neobacillus drentensis]